MVKCPFDEKYNEESGAIYGKSSSFSVFTSGPKFFGFDQEFVVLLYFENQISFPPKPPGNSEAKNKRSKSLENEGDRKSVV